MKHQTVRIQGQPVIILFVFMLIAAIMPRVSVEAGGGKEVRVMTGIEVLASRGFDIIAGKRVGLITNHTGIDSKGKSTIDILAETDKTKLVAIFAPEHGVRGEAEAGEKVSSDRDQKTGLPIHSLYGKTLKPTREMLHGIDVLVYDIQDVGVRFYTYISTMAYAMEAAAENGLEFVVLDRPNPIGGVEVEGPILEEKFSSLSDFIRSCQVWDDNR